MTTRASWPLWQPPADTLETLAEVVASHWNAARTYGERTFWPTATNWLRQATRAYLNNGHLLRPTPIEHLSAIVSRA